VPAQIQPDPIGDYFPTAPYAIGRDSAEEDPLRALANAGNEFVFIFIAECIRMRAMASVQLAVGPYLDYHGALYGVQRLTNELDGPYRARILAGVIALTIPALTTLSNAYFRATDPPGFGTSAIVWDCQSNPALAAVVLVPDILTGDPRLLIPGEFVVDVTSVFPAYDAFFLDYSALDNGFLINIDPTVYTSATYPDKGLVNIINPKKAAGFRPIFRFTGVPV
jgi:hypothetical protein